ncbi:MAG: hypothetical protein ABSG17_18435 [Spirochaetia bacterium]
MKRFMIVGLIVLFIVAVPFSVLSEPRSKGVSSGYAVCNPNHTQALGGQSTHAVRGLSEAAEHSKAVHCTTPVVSPVPGGTTGGTTSSGGSGGVPVVTPVS